jgi:carbohydrate-selective porin OprB
VKRRFQDRGITYDLQTALFFQYADDVVTGEKSLWTLAYQLTADWALTRDDRLGTGHLGTTLLGSVGLDYDTDDETLSENAGVISIFNGTVYPDPIAVDELFWKQVLPDAFVAQAGVLDLSNWFDTNTIANDGFSQFFASSLENNLSIPFPTYGGFGALLRWSATDDLYIMAGIADARSNNAEAPWKSIRDDSLYELVEVGLSIDIDGLGRGTYRFTPWHASQLGTSGWGIAVSFDQELWSERLVSFFRFGVGDQDVTAVGTFVSGGLGLKGPFGRADDLVAAGVSWSDPAPGTGFRQETLVEVLYRVAITPSLALTPDLQVVFDPAENPDTSTIWVAGLRFTASF